MKVAPCAAVPLGEDQAGPSQVDHLPPQPVGVAAGVLFHLPDQCQGALPGQEFLGAVLQHLLDFAQAKVHCVSSGAPAGAGATVFG